MTELKNEPSHVPHVRPPRYDFRAIEAKWRKRWEEEKLYEVDLYTAQNPFYNLMMFPYPSAEGCTLAICMPSSARISMGAGEP
jgi:valyl-tRNA synthetase